jgi:hypothetical protein
MKVFFDPRVLKSPRVAAYPYLVIAVSVTLLLLRAPTRMEQVEIELLCFCHFGPKDCWTALLKENGYTRTVTV